MLKRYTFWLWVAVVFQFLTAGIHAISLFVQPDPANETERQLYELITTYRMDAGAGFTPTFADLFKALSSCFTLLYAFAGLTNAFLLRRHADAGVMGGILLINLLICGAAFTIMAFLTFLPPIVLTGLVFGFLLISFLLLPKDR
jgi:hypothetical protein